MSIREEVLQEAERLRPLFEEAGEETGFPPALLAAIAVRESGCGLDLDDQGLGDNGHGHGLMQVDDRSFGGLFTQGINFWTDPMWSIATGAAILDSKYGYLENHTSLTGRELTWAAVAAYNCGEGNVSKVASQLAGYKVEDDQFWSLVDSFTANHDYARAVWVNAQELVAKGWRDGTGTPAAAPCPPPATPATPQPSAPPAKPQAPVTAPQPAAPTATSPDQTYTVKDGDTLAAISQKFYGDPNLYRQVAYYNGICDPDLIIVGQVLEIPSQCELTGKTVTPAAPGVVAPSPPHVFPPPNGLEAIIACFGDLRQYIRTDGTLDPAWETEKLGLSALPYPIPLSWDMAQTVKRMQCHKKLVDIFPEVFAAIAKAGLQALIKDYGGCFAYRSKRTSAKLSAHSWGIAIDLNPLTNPMGRPGDMNPEVVAIFREFGFKWGGDWAGSGQDPMHFQYCTGY